MIEASGYQICALDLTQIEAKTIISAYRGSGRTTLGLLAARICANEGCLVGFVSDSIHDWKDYRGEVFDFSKNKRVFPGRSRTFDGNFPNGGRIELMRPDSLWKIRGDYYDFVIADDADYWQEDYGTFLEANIGRSGLLVLGCVFDSQKWFRNCWTQASERGWTSLAFHIVPQLQKA